MNDSKNVFDNPTFFDGYKQIRNKADNENHMVADPALFSLAPDLTGKKVLDIGCGYGHNCTRFREMGATYVLGVDLSEKMIAAARELNPENEYMRADGSDLTTISGKFDTIFSAQTLHYIEDFAKLCSEVAAMLNEGGHFIFSQLHPMATASFHLPNEADTPNEDLWGRDENGEKLHWKLRNYGLSGKREVLWLENKVINHHRSISEIVNTLIAAGFVIEAMLEPVPGAEIIAEFPKYADYIHRSNFLLIRAKLASK